MVVFLVLSLDVFHLLTRVGKHYHVVDNLASETSQLLVPLLDLLVKSLILDFELFIVDKMQTFSQLFFLLQHFLLVCKSVPQRNVLQTVLMDLLILGFIGFLPFFDDFGAEFLAGPAVDSVHRDRPLQLLELLLDFGTLGLLLVELILEFASHSVVPILGLLEVVSDLMHVCQRVQVLVLVKHLISVLLVVTIIGVHKDDLSLAILVSLLELLVLTSLILNGRNELFFHGCGGREVTSATVVIFIAVILILRIAIVGLVLI